MSQFRISRSNIRNLVLILFVSAAIPGCHKSPDAVTGNSGLENNKLGADVNMDVDAIDPWQGIYTSTSEIRGFSGTAIAIGPELNGKRSYREHFYSCMGPPSNPLVPVCETNGNELTITKGWKNTDPELAELPPFKYETKYTRLKLNNRLVLMRDDALNFLKTEDKLYDYGVLFKISDDANSIEDLATAPHPSIKSLYNDPNAVWNDPFVHGANSRD